MNSRTGEVRERTAEEKPGDHRGKQGERDDKPNRPRHHTTSKWLIQPSSANSRLVRVEHVEARLMLARRELEDAALRLALHDRVDGAQRRRQRRAVVVVVEEVGVQVERVDRIELGDVDEIDRAPAGSARCGSAASV